METVDRSLPSVLEEQASARPERVWLREVSGRTVTFGAAAVGARQWAAAMRGIGVGAGDHVVCMYHNTADAQLCWAGLSWLGAVEAPVNTDYRGALLAHAFDLTAARHVVTLREFVPRFAELYEHAGQIETMVLLDGPAPSTRDLPFIVVSVDDLLEGVGPADDLVLPRPWDIGAVLFTSGTTGPSKAVRLPWGQLDSTAVGTFPAKDFADDDVLYSPGPTYHIGAKVFPMLAAYLAIPVVLRPYISVSEMANDLVGHGVTVGALLPPASIDAAERATGEKCRLRYALVPYKVDGVDQIKEALAVRTIGCFNMTEVSVPIVDPDWDCAVHDDRGRLSCGRVRAGYPGYEARIVDEHDQPVPDGEVGELVVRSSAPWTMNAGYLAMPGATAHAWRNGWFHTGDAMYRDEDGNFYFIDRIKDCIRRRSENISSFDVESYINEHPAVAESAAVAVKVTDQAGADEEVKVVVRLQPGQQLSGAQLVEWAIGRMPRFMIPRYVDIVEELPRTPTQKVRKVALREQGVQESTFDRVAAGIALPRTGTEW